MSNHFHFLVELFHNIILCNFLWNPYRKTDDTSRLFLFSIKDPKTRWVVIMEHVILIKMITRTKERDSFKVFTIKERIYCSFFLSQGKGEQREVFCDHTELWA